MRLFVLAIVITMISGVLLINSANKNMVSSEQTPQVLAASTTVETFEPMLAAINAYRQQNGLDSLQMSAEAMQLTNYRVSDMVSKHYYSHKSPTGASYASIIKDYLPESVSSCENLQLQNSDDINQAVVAWSNSSSHKNCLLNPKLKIGAVSVAFFDDVSNPSTESESTYVFAFIGSN